MTSERTSVLVAGGGLTGLSTAVFLGCQGIDVLVAEQRAGTLAHPRARTINPRTVELYRQAGLERAIMRERQFTHTRSATFVRAHTVAGEELRRGEVAPPEGAGGGAEASPCAWAPIDQDVLELLLRDRAAELGVQVRFDAEVVSFEQDAHGVRALVRDRETGREREVEADYLVGADGHASTVRRSLGIGVHGPGSLNHLVSVMFDADLSKPMRGRGEAYFHLDTPAVGTILLPHDRSTRWVFSTPYRPDRGETVAQHTEDRCVELIRAAVGVPDLEVRLLPQLADGTKVLGYHVAAQVAETFQRGRVFLVGDAAHLMPPAGAFGAGTGVLDAHNLAWKLAAVLSGTAGPRLLESYSAERIPAVEFTVGQALAQFAARSGRPVPGAGEPADYFAVVFGHRYARGALDGAEADGPAALPPAELRGQVGTRAPHVVLTVGGRRGSTLDLFGPGFTLLAGPGAAGWADTVPGVRAVVVGRDVTDVDDRWHTAYAAEHDGAVLVRPDGIVAWRRDSVGPDAPDLTEVLDRLLRRRERSVSAVRGGGSTMAGARR